MATDVAFRVDSSREIGTGHVVRCLTLAGALTARGASCRFVCRDLPGAIIELIEAAGHPVALLPAPTAPALFEGPYAAWLGVDWRRDAEETVAALAGTETGWLVVDHYAIDQRWEGRVRSAAPRLLVIDDLANRPHDCDILLDQQAVDRMEERYRGLVPDHCTTLIGSRFAQLRPVFAQRRQQGLRDRGEPIRRLLIFLGGADEPNMSLRVIEALDPVVTGGLTVDLVVGLANPHAAGIEAAAAERPWLSLHPGDSDMGALMAGADLMVGGAGTTIWERCALGLPTVAVAMAENQVAGAECVGREGAMLYLGRVTEVDGPTITAAIMTLAASPCQRVHMARQGAALVDGRGAERVAAAMLGDVIEVRLADAADAEIVRAWRNAPAVRAVSANPNEIAAASHRDWFARVLADDSRHLLIGERDGAAVGVVRFDRTDDRATVSIFLAPERIGQGLGRELLAAGIRWLTRNALDCQWVEAEVMAGHAPSHRLFLDSGFVPVSSRYRRRLR